MSQPIETTSSRALELRRAFDDSFTAPPAEPPADLEDYLAVRAGDGHYVIRTSQLTGLVVSSRIVPLPVAARGLLGLAGVRGELVPVYQLALLLGHESAAQERWWVALVGSDQPVGLAIQELEGHLRAPRADLQPPAGPADGKYLSQTLLVGSELRSVVDVQAIVSAIRNQSGGAPQQGNEP